MNIEPEMVVLLMKEVKASSMSELAKSMLMKVLGSNEVVEQPIDKPVYRVVSRPQQTAPQPAQQPIVGGAWLEPTPKPSPYNSNRGGAGHHKNIEGAQRREELFPRIYAETIEKLYKHFSNTGYEITLPELWKRYSLTRPSDRYLLRQYMVEMAAQNKQMVVIYRNAYPGFGVSHTRFDFSKAVMGGSSQKDNLPASNLPRTKSHGYRKPNQPKVAQQPVKVVAEFDKGKKPVEHKDYPFSKGEPQLKPMTRKQFMVQFRSEATKKHIAEGFDYMKATQMATQDYCAYLTKNGISKVRKHGSKATKSEAATPPAATTDGEQQPNSDTYEKVDATPAVFVEMPDIKGIKMQLKPYLKDLLRKLDSCKMPCLTESMDAYVLDLPDGVWNDFMADVLVKQEQVKAALKLTASKDFIIRQNKLFFE